jgi:leader peptidase (prepilin peptidase)/N-methyltransferase
MNGTGSAEPVTNSRNRWCGVVAVAVGVIVSFVLLPLPAAGFAALLACVAVTIAVVDIESLIIPDVANLVLFVLGAAFVLTEAGSDGASAATTDALLRSAVSGGILYLMRFAYGRATGVTGLGLGDVKLAAAGAPFLAWATLPLALALAAVAGVLAAVTAAVVHGAALERRMEIPFGAFLAPAIWLSLIFERNGLFQF